MAQFNPHIADYPALSEWIDKHSARHLWTAKSDGVMPCVQGWNVMGAVVLVVFYAPKNDEKPQGWGIAVEPNTIDIKKTFAEIERQIGANL